MDSFRIIALSHKALSIDEVGEFHLDDSIVSERLKALRMLPGIEEVMILSTCNRVEFLLNLSAPLSDGFLFDIFRTAYSAKDEAFHKKALRSAVIFSGEEAVSHLFRVASSLDSMVVGEREIITQVRNAFEFSKDAGTTGDMLRLVIKKTIETGKQVYTETNIAKNPVSVVSLAYRKLRDLNVKLNSRFLLIGAGVTISTYGKFLKKHGYSNFVIFNRTLTNAERLASELEAVSMPLSELDKYVDGFDVIVACTGAAEPIIDNKIFTALLAGDTKKKVVVDLAVPGDIHPEVIAQNDIHHISVASLKEVSENNLREREKELDQCAEIIQRNILEFRVEFRSRQVELAMQEVPKKIKDIRDIAMNEVFARDLKNMDEESKKVLGKVIDYLEKKYISVPMKMAKEILLEEAATK